MSGGATSRRRHVEEEEHENHERWLVTYADLLTVLMALFIVMFAMSVVDKTKFEKLKQGLDEYFGHGPELVDGGSGLLSQQEATDQVDVDVAAAVAALHSERNRSAAAEKEKQDLLEAQRKILAVLKQKGLEDSVRFTIDDRGLVVTIVTDDVLFELGSADLRDAGREVLDGIGPALVPLPNPVTVEGHTDNLPIRGGRFPSNWELSTERATTVLRYLLEDHRLPAGRLSAAGYADQRPVASNTPAGRHENRRVEVVVRSVAADPTAVVKPAGQTEPVPVVPAQAAPAQEEEDR
jgi:chemotaxis protein MotB